MTSDIAKFSNGGHDASATTPAALIFSASPGWPTLQFSNFFSKNTCAIIFQND